MEAALPRGIPKAPFSENIADYFKSNKDGSGGAAVVAKPEEVLGSFQQLLSKYRFMESGLSQRRAVLQQKLPEIEKSLELVQFFLSEKKDDADDADADADDADEEGEGENTFPTHYEINDTLYAEAKVLKAPKHVNLWLGANVMVQYELEEAEKLLREKKETAEKSIASLDHDISVLKEQITTMEVNVARVYNFNVQLQKQQNQ